jgi:hypothetical protein
MSLVATDPKLKQVLSNLEKRKVVPHKAYIKEALELHAKLPKLVPRGSQLATSLVRINADRNRIVQIKTVCMSESLEIKDVMSRLSDHLSTKYVSYLSQFKNQAARNSILAEALAPFTRRTRPLANALEIIDVVLSDYDKTSFAIRDCCAALQLAERET